MPDPVDLSMVVSSALPATFTFLYHRLEAVLSRRENGPGAPQADDAPEIPSALVGELKLPLRANPDRVDERLRELQAYALGLERYSRDTAEITLHDPLLIQTLSALRETLEYVYGQQFTFDGERRGESGPSSELRLGTVAGEVTVMEATGEISGGVKAVLEADSVERGGKAVGMRAHNINGKR